MIRKTCYEDVCAHLEHDGRAASKVVIAARVGFRPSTVGTVLTRLRKRGMVVLHKNRYWRWA